MQFPFAIVSVGGPQVVSWSQKQETKLGTLKRHQRWTLEILSVFSFYGSWHALCQWPLVSNRFLFFITKLNSLLLVGIAQPKLLISAGHRHYYHYYKTTSALKRLGARTDKIYLKNKTFFISLYTGSIIN